MKKLILLSCSNVSIRVAPNDDNKSSELPFEGTWKLYFIYRGNPYDLNEDGTYCWWDGRTNCYQTKPSSLKVNNRDLGDRSLCRYFPDLVIGTTNDYEYTVTCVQQNDETAFTWSKSGNSVTITGGGVPFTATLSGNNVDLSDSARVYCWSGTRQWHCVCNLRHYLRVYKAIMVLLLYEIQPKHPSAF